MCAVDVSFYKIWCTTKREGRYYCLTGVQSVHQSGSTISQSRLTLDAGRTYTTVGLTHHCHQPVIIEETKNQEEENASRRSSRCHAQAH
jgi:hypothetical protein